MRERTTILEYKKISNIIQLDKTSTKYLAATKVTLISFQRNHTKSIENKRLKIKLSNITWITIILPISSSLVCFSVLIFGVYTFFIEKRFYRKTRSNFSDLDSVSN